MITLNKIHADNCTRNENCPVCGTDDIDFNGIFNIDDTPIHRTGYIPKEYSAYECNNCKIRYRLHWPENWEISGDHPYKLDILKPYKVEVLAHEST